jgi:hypothetical protein
MIHRGIATLAMGLVVCFLLLSHFDSEFFLFHFYESLIYLAIILMLFYFEDRWAYMLGIVAPTSWILVAIVTGGFGELWRQVVQRIFLLGGPGYAATCLGGIITVLSLAMIAFCTYQWKRQFSGQGKGLATFLVSLGIVVGYYGVMVFWLWWS